MGREGGQGSSDRGGGERAPVGELAAMGSVGAYCRPRQGGTTMHGPPSCLVGRMTVKIFIPGGLQIQLLVGESMSSAQCRGVQGSAGRCRAGRAHAKTEVFHKN